MKKPFILGGLVVILAFLCVAYYPGSMTSFVTPAIQDLNMAGFNVTNAGGISGTNLTIWPPLANPAWGALLTYDGTNSVWIRNTATGWIFDEEFIGISTSGSIGREAWQLKNVGGGTCTELTGESGAPGLVRSVVTNTADVGGCYIGLNNAPDAILCTNLELYFVTRLRTWQTNSGTDDLCLEVGLGTKAATNSQRGIYIQLSNNVWTGVINNNGTATKCPMSNAVPREWTYLAWHLDTTGTNVDFYQGGTPSAMTYFGRYSNQIPTAAVGPVFYAGKMVGTTTRMTNDIDLFKLWSKRLP